MAQQSHRSLRRMIFFSVLLILLGVAFGLGITLGKGGTPSTKILVVTPTPSPTPTPVIQIYNVSLDSRTELPGMDTGALLTFGERLAIKASGKASFCQGCNPTNPDGVSLVNGKPYTQPASDAIYPSAPLGTLLGSIVPKGSTPPSDWFVVGSSYSVTVWTNGELYFIYNENSNYHSDNSGSYQVTITVIQG